MSYSFFLPPPHLFLLMFSPDAEEAKVLLGILDGPDSH